MFKAPLFRVCVALLVSACGEETAENSSEGTTLDAGVDAGSQTATDAAPSMVLGRCGDPMPPDVTGADAPPTYEGICPELAPGRNQIMSQGSNREFVLVLPEDAGDEPLPVLFMWHWLGGSANSFVEVGDLQRAANEYRFIAVVPEEKGDLQFRWPYTALDSNQRLEEELQFFDDMYACVAEEFVVDPQCVSTIGVSAGALWSSQLGPRRSQYLASVVSLSGGVGEAGGNFNPIRTFDTYEHKLPVLVLWGGEQDTCGVNFDDLSTNLEDELTSDGHYVVECLHNCGHTAPPPDPGEEGVALDGFWQFVLDHPHWVPDGQSIYDTTGLPEVLPTWCAVGAGNAVSRSGTCPENGVSCE